MLMSKHCSSFYFRCKTTVVAFTLPVTVMLLLTDLTSAPDDQSIGIDRILPENKRKSIADTHIDTAYKKYRRYLRQYSKSIINTIGSNTNIAILTTLIISDYN